MTRWTVLPARTLLLLAATGSLLFSRVATVAGDEQSCNAPEYGQFSFWIGEWDVVTPGGERAGRNTITGEQDGCALVEHWTGADGHTGTSLNYYDRATRRWYQSWISQSGGALRLSGELVGGRMILSSEPTPSMQGGTVVNRITWTPASAREVRQLWEASRDEGRTWTVVFDGIYKRRGK